MHGWRVVSPGEDKSHGTNCNRHRNSRWWFLADDPAAGEKRMEMKLSSEEAKQRALELMYRGYH